MEQAESEISQEQQVAASIAGLPITEIFPDGPRRMFLERVVPKIGTYRLYIARPFGVVKHGGMKWRVQITVQFEGREDLVSLNDGKVQAPLHELGGVIIEAAGMLDKHIQASKRIIAKVRRAGMRLAAQEPEVMVVEPGECDAGQGVTGHTPVTVTGCDGGEDE